MTGSASRLAGPNPFVGPRPFEPGETLYGRENEIGELYYLWKAERIVLLYSPSGAGKSSLLQAGLLPQIQESFDVWGPTRVNLEPPEDLPQDSQANRYVLSAMQGFEESIPERLRRPPEELAGMRLSEYVETRPRRRRLASKNVALLFDQFEEILTVKPLATAEKREFFDQLGEVLRDPQVWALFVLREDYLAPLDPYARQIPTHFKNRFRIDLLSIDSARQALVKPSQERGRAFPAADQLLLDLAKMKVQQPDGSFVEEAGRHVEPVQLQVVCLRLWDAMPADDLSIDLEDLERFGDVTEALSGYYADSVRQIAESDVARERAIREWFGERLITAGGHRGQVMRGAETSEGLPNEVIESVLNTHLVRAEKRAGATWYELAHDRLIEPVRTDNAAWRSEHLSEVQQRATLWTRQGHPRGLLLRDAELATAERWAATLQSITESEARFLEESRKAQDVADRERRQAVRIKRLGFGALIIGGLTLIAGVLAVQQMFKAEILRDQAEEQRQRAEEKEGEAREQSLRAEREAQIAEAKRREAERQRQRAAEEKRAADAAREQAEIQRRLAVANEKKALEQQQEALAQRHRAAENEKEAKEQAMAARLAQSEAAESARESARLRRIAEAEALAVRTTSLTDARVAALLAVEAYRINQTEQGEAENPDIYNAMRLALGELDASRLVRHAAEVRSLAVSPNGRLAVSGTDGGEIRSIDYGDLTASTLKRLDGSVRALAWSAEGEWLAAGDTAGVVEIWSFAEGHASAGKLLGAPGPVVHALGFSPTGPRLVAGDAGGGVRLWDLAGDDGARTLLASAAAQGTGTTTDPGGMADSADAILAVAWSSDGLGLVAASVGRGVLVWDDVDSDSEPRVLAEPGVRAVAFSRDGKFMAGGQTDGYVLLWNRSTGVSEPTRLLGHTARVTAVHFHPQSRLLASASADGTVRLWNVEHPEALPLVLMGHHSWVWDVAFSPDGTRLLSASSDRTVRLWTTKSEILAHEICGATDADLSEDEWRRYLPERPYRDTCSGL